MIWAQELNYRYSALYGAQSARLLPAETLQSKLKVLNAFCDQYSVALAIEIHFNSSPSGGRGSETLCYPGSQKGIIAANKIQAVLGAVYPPSRGVKEGWYKMDRPGIVDYPGDVDGDETPDYFLRKSKCTSLIIEPEFIQNFSTIQSQRDMCIKKLIPVIRELELEFS